METKYIDTHAHLNLSAFADDADEMAKRCAEEGVVMFNVGTKESTSRRAAELAEQYENCYAIIGLHPIQTASGTHDVDEIGEGGEPFTSKGEEFDITAYLEMAKGGKVIGVGECGFDYYRTTPDTYALQEKNFIAQIELANQLDVPLMIHTRNPGKGQDSPTGNSVYDDVRRTLRQHAKVPFNIHFFAGTLEDAKKFIDMGGTISFTGVITFAKEYAEIVKNVPLDKIHAETDCPYVAPVPYRGKRCEPWMVKETYKKIAEIRAEDEERVRQQLVQNAEQFYKL
jgi:TatD DNase family protein